MAKKEKIAVETQEVEIVEPDTNKTESIEKTDKKANKDNKADKKTAKKPKKEKKGGIGKKIKESVSEIKKVNWPTFGKVCKQTGMVISVVVVCTLVLFGIDRLLSLLFTWLAY